MMRTTPKTKAGHLLLLLTALITMNFAQAAKPVPAPSQQLKTDENIVAVVSVKGKSGAQKLNINVEQMLHGEATTEATVKLDESSLAEAKIGERYVLAFSWFSKDPLTRGKGWVKNSEGPEVVGFTEVASALLPANPALIHLLGLSMEPIDDAARIDNSLQLLADDHYKLRYLAALELLLTPRLAAAFTPVQRDQLKAVLAMPGYAPEHRDLMYRVALTLPADLQQHWVAEQARKDLVALGSQYDLASRVPSLAKVATQALRDHGAATDAPLLSGLLRSNAPGVAKMALHALVNRAKTEADASVVAALADKALPSESRRVLEIYRKSGKLPG